jgi:hypothetical protein
LLGKERPVKRKRFRILSSDSEDEDEEEAPSSSSESEEEKEKPLDCEKIPNQGGYKIPKRKNNSAWTEAQIQNFKLKWPHLKNFDDSVLKHATLTELTAMGRQKVSGSKLLSQILSRNFENVQNFPGKVAEGEDNCLGKAHTSRFLRGYAGDAQDLWLQAREVWGANGIEPMANYEVVSMGLGDNLTHRVWAEIHKPSSRVLSVRLLSPKSVEEAWKESDKSDSPHEFDNMHDFKVAMATLEGGIHRVSPWNFAFKTLHLFMLSINYGENELGGKTNKPVHLANFVDEILRSNARNWEEKKKFLSYQDISVRWSASLSRLSGGKELSSQKKQEKSKEGQHKFKKLPGWVCRRYNEGRCDSKDDKHQAHWDPSYVLKHVCSKWLNEKKRYCLDTHPESEHR